MCLLIGSMQILFLKLAITILASLIGIPNDTLLHIGVYNDLHYLHGVPPKILFYFLQ
jgi:hypothetical protein